jgi:hypothetical protein
LPWSVQGLHACMSNSRWRNTHCLFSPPVKVFLSLQSSILQTVYVYITKHAPSPSRGRGGGGLFANVGYGEKYGK